jgi:hypothetical protein
MDPTPYDRPPGPPRPPLPTTSMSTGGKIALVGCIGMLLFLALCVAVLIWVQRATPPTPHSDTPPSPAPQRSESPTVPLEYKLAVLNAGTPVAQDDITIIRFRYLLNSLKRSAPSYTEQQIADLCYTAVQMVHDRYGVTVSLKDFMERCNQEAEASPARDLKLTIGLLVIAYGR